MWLRLPLIAKSYCMLQNQQIINSTKKDNIVLVLLLNKLYFLQRGGVRSGTFAFYFIFFYFYRYHFKNTSNSQ